MKLEDLKILVCDDSRLARKKIKETLDKVGITHITEAEDGQKAVDSYKTHKPDFVLMDITMPEKDGIKALAEIIEFDNEAKVIMASSIGTSGKLAEAITIGAFNFLQKPVDGDKLAHILKEYVENK